MPSAYEMYQPKLNSAQALRDQLLQQYNAYASVQPTYFQKLLDEIKKTGNWPSESAIEAQLAARAPTGVVMNPGVYENLAGQYGSARRQTIGDLMNRAYGNYQGEVASRQGAFNQANQSYADLMNEYGNAQQQENWQKTFNEQQRQFNAQMAKASANQPGGADFEAELKRWRDGILAGTLDINNAPQELRSYLGNDKEVQQYIKVLGVKDAVNAAVKDIMNGKDEATGKPLTTAQKNIKINELSQVVANDYNISPAKVGLPTSFALQPTSYYVQQELNKTSGADKLLRGLGVTIGQSFLGKLLGWQ